MSRMVIVSTVILVQFNSGCAPVAVSFVTGMVVLKTSEVSLHVTDKPSEILECDYLGREKKHVLWGGLIFQNSAHKKAVNELSLWAESEGGDTLLLEETTKTFKGSSATGRAYRCAF